MSTLPLCILLSFTLFFPVKSTCNFRYSTENHPCNTKAALLECDKFTHSKIENESWSYYFIFLESTIPSFIDLNHTQDIQKTIELDLKIDGPSLDAYLLFKNASQYALPNRATYDEFFHLNKSNKAISLDVPSEVNGGWLAVGLYNPSTSSNIHVKIRYSMNGGNCKCPMSKIVMALILSLWTSASIVFFIGICWMKKLGSQIQQRNPSGMLNVRRNSAETEGRFEVLTEFTNEIIQENAQQKDNLTLKEIEEYFPKQDFQNIKNPFFQTACSICLEEFHKETQCSQLFCHHIFHKVCIKNWLEKHNSCPDCRVSVTKDMIKEFLERHKTVQNQHLT